MMPLYFVSLYIYPHTIVYFINVDYNFLSLFFCIFITGERLIQYASENLVTEILIHPQYNTLIQCMRNMLSSFTRHRHLIHAGYTFSGNGSWILQVNDEDKLN